MSELLPYERMALTVARAQLERGEEPTPNVAMVCIMALARLADPAAPSHADPAPREATDG